MVNLSRLRRRARIALGAMGRTSWADALFRLSLILVASLTGAALWHRTINMWSMKNLGDAFLTKHIGSRMIVLGTFMRERSEQNVDGNYGVVHFLGDARDVHDLYCFSKESNGAPFVSRAYIQRIHQGKRAANDICSWAGHLAECRLPDHHRGPFRIGTIDDPEQSLLVTPEVPKEEKKHELAVCVAPMYIYMDWEIMLTGIETWLALGATKIIVPIQSASETTYNILRAYEKRGLVTIRHWPKWPVLSDSNPNGLVLSRGIEESHVNCLFHVKPFADMVVFTDIDDMLLPVDPTEIRAGGNIEIIKRLFTSHPQAGSLLFEHRDTQLRLPSASPASLGTFNFDFLHDSKSKQNCQVWRMKTRVVVKAARVDSVNMHETGIHRYGYVQTRVPCRLGHFYHLRHSHNSVEDAASISLGPLAEMLNRNWRRRLLSTFGDLSNTTLSRSDTESFADFDRCMSAINEEHWTLSVSRCLTPHVCFSRLKREVACVASDTDYSFVRSGDGYLIAQNNHRFIPSLHNCEAPVPPFTEGNHFFAP